AVTKAGSYKVLVPVGMSVLLWQRDNWRRMLFLSFYALGVPLLETAAKRAVARPRPPDYFVADPALHASHGFPSGHALAAAALYACPLVLLRRRIRPRRWQWVSSGGLLLLIFLIGSSRLYLGAHWPSDVLGGYALGGAYCSLARMVCERREGSG